MQTTVVTEIVIAAISHQWTVKDAESLSFPSSPKWEIITLLEQSFPEFREVDSRQYFGFAVLFYP